MGGRGVGRTGGSVILASAYPRQPLLLRRQSPGAVALLSHAGAASVGGKRQTCSEQGREGSDARWREKSTARQGARATGHGAVRPRAAARHRVERTLPPGDTNRRHMVPSATSSASSHRPRGGPQAGCGPDCGHTPTWSARHPTSRAPRPPLLAHGSMVAPHPSCPAGSRRCCRHHAWNGRAMVQPGAHFTCPPHLRNRRPAPSLWESGS